MKHLLKSCLRLAIGFIGCETVTIVAGPIRGGRLLKQHGLQNLSMLFGTYESKFSRAFSGRVRESDVIYDIGANTGYFSLLAAKQHRPGGQVFAFEPVPEIADDLRAMVAANSLSERVHTYTIAFSDSVGQARMCTPGSTTAFLQAVTGEPLCAEMKGLDVEMSTLDDFVFSGSNPPPDLIKLDVERAEGLVLAGAKRVLREFRPVVLVEVHGVQPAMDVWDISVALGYKVRLLGASGEIGISDRGEWIRLFDNSKWKIQHCVLQPPDSYNALAA